MIVIKGSYRNPNGGYEATVVKGSVRVPPVEKPEYEIEAGVTKGSIRKPPVNTLSYEQTEPYIISAESETGLASRL